MEPGPATVKRAEFRLGEWLIQPSLNRAAKGSRVAHLRPMLMDLLVVLADHAGQVVSKDEILEKVWGVRYVGESALARSVGELRRVFEDDPDHPRVIETIAKRGYRLLAPVTFEGCEPEAAAGNAVAVLPFTDLSPGGDQEYFCDGLAEELINSLTSVPGLRVVARTSAFAFKGKSMDVREIARQLNADTVMEGGLQRVGQRLRITVQLIDAKNGYHLWSERFDRDLEDVFALEDEITRAVAEKLRTRVAGERPLVRASTADPEVHRLCLRGRYHYAKMNAPDMAVARECFEQALARDAGCAAAWSGLSASCWEGAQWGFFSSPDDLPRGRRAAFKAVELDPELEEAHATLGVFLGAYDFAWAAAEREFARALELRPASPTVRERYAMYFLQPMLRLDEAVEQLRGALELDPLSPLLHTQLGHLYVFRREYDRGLEEGHHALALDPGYPLARAVVGMALVFQEKFQELQAALGRLPSPAMENNSLTLGGLGWTLALTGQHDQARAILAALEDRSRFPRTSAWSMAWIHVGLGEHDEAFRWLQRAVEERDPKLAFLRNKPFWDPLRADPRFDALLRQMKLVQ